VNTFAIRLIHKRSGSITVFPVEGMFDVERSMPILMRGASGVTLLLPDIPIGTNGFEHGFGGLVQPLSFFFL